MTIVPNYIADDIPEGYPSIQTFASAGLALNTPLIECRGYAGLHYSIVGNLPPSFFDQMNSALFAIRADETGVNPVSVLEVCGRTAEIIIPIARRYSYITIVSGGNQTNGTFLNTVTINAKLIKNLNASYVTTTNKQAVVNSATVPLNTVGIINIPINPPFTTLWVYSTAVSYTHLTLPTIYSV